MSEQNEKEQSSTSEEFASTRVEEFTFNGEEVVAKVKSLIQEGNVRRLKFTTEAGRPLLDLPLTAGVAGLAVGALLAPLLTVIATAVAVFAKVRISVERVEVV